MKRRLENISTIPFEKDLDEDFVHSLRYGQWRELKTPTNFRQTLLTDIWGDLIERTKNVLEIGCGTGRNAQFFLNQTDHINYYGFDQSKTSLKYFKKNKYWDFTDKEHRFYVSNEVDEKILGQKYDLIFSTFVLQHIGFTSPVGIHNATSLTECLFDYLKVDGYWMSYELSQGQNEWNPFIWANSFEVFEPPKFKRVRHEINTRLEGSSDGPDYHLIIFKKLRD